MFVSAGQSLAPAHLKYTSLDVRESTQHTDAPLSLMEMKAGCRASLKRVGGEASTAVLLTPNTGRAHEESAPSLLCLRPAVHFYIMFQSIALMCARKSPRGGEKRFCEQACLHV